MINDDWQFLKGGLDQAAASEDAGWEKVALPHTWNLADGSNGKGDYYRGVGWYRKRLTIPREDAGRRVFLRFGAVGKAADVYVNDVHVGRHEGAYAAFCFDITDCVKFGEENLIAVKADNSPTNTLPIIPLSGDFTQWGGIVRDVKLLTLEPIHVTPMDFASPGVYLTTKDVSEPSARVEIKTMVRNATASPREITVKITVYDADGQVVATDSLKQMVSPNGDRPAFPFLQEFSIDKPHLWNGVKDPYLYRVAVEVSADGKTTDHVEQPLGLRYYHVDPNKGFFLNGQHLNLHGVALHEDWEGKGRALSDQDRERDIELIREMGANWLRLSHYQHAEHIYDLTDRAGIVTWTEIPLVNDIQPTKAFTRNCRRQLQELIRQNYNHPSVCFWGLYNELRPKPDPSALVSDLHRLAHAEDPVRPTTAANSWDIPTQWIPDVICWNKYYGWYYDGKEAKGLAAFLDHTQKKYPFRCLGISEYGAGANVLHHEENPPRPKTVLSKWHPEEYQADFHEIHWKHFKSRPFTWCITIWATADFASDGRREGSNPGINDKGLVTRDRKIKKDAFYWYQCNWTEEPMVYITSRRFTPRKKPTTEVKVYSNCTDVELFVNGQSLGKKTSDDHIFRWKGVKLAEGDNMLKAVGRTGEKTCQDACAWELKTAE
ncbi:MAG TPA: glycoside hydrolase family 2 TIM barrel-domain containing protein [Thermoguttaceae bacterium]|nr:glycoside hydrolase family 2 TIM barrel-domain containing protein [Thermoguttaceae bacterium]